MKNAFLRTQTKCCIYIPERRFNKYWFIDVALSSNNNRLSFTNVIICISHNSATSVNGIFTMWVLDFRLIFTVDYCENIRKSRHHNISSSSARPAEIAISNSCSSAKICAVGAYSTGLYSVFLYLFIERS